MHDNFKPGALFSADLGFVRLSEMSVCRGVSPVGWGSRPPDFWQEGRGSRRGSWDIIIAARAYFEQEVCWKREQLAQNVIVNGNFLKKRRNFFSEWLK